jgi:pyrroline-5-carboxylate reductase
MAGVTINTIQEVLDTKNIIRIMPNVMAKQNASHTYVYVKTNKLINNLFKKILKSFGTFHVCSKEDEINIATAIYGSGPAFIAHIVNAFVAASKNISPNTKVNEKDIITLFQSVISINNSSQKLEEFVQSIASKKGTTQAGVNFLKSQNLKKIMYTTLHRAYKRAKEISIEKQGLK